MGALELTDIKVVGERVTGIVENYRSPNGACFSEKTPFNGTYRNGLLAIESMPLGSQQRDSHPCGGIAFEVKISAGRASGTYKAGPLQGRVELEAIAPLWSTLGQDFADKPELHVGDEWIFAQRGSEDGIAANPRWRRRIVEKLPDDKIRVVPPWRGFDVYDGSWNPRHPERPTSSPLDYQFPLRVGATWSFASPLGNLDTSGRSFEERGRYKVVAMETISVPAGTFRCFRIEGEISLIISDGYSPDWKQVYRTLSTRWYCPDVRYMAKMHIERAIVGTFVKGANYELDSELIEFKPGKATNPRPSASNK